MKNRRRKLGIAFFIGVIYYGVIRYTSLGIPCLFYQFFHIRCPGCGITRMLCQMSCFHWKQAMRSNYFLFFTGPLLFLMLLRELRETQKVETRKRIWNTIEIMYVVALILWMIVRNILKI